MRYFFRWFIYLSLFNIALMTMFSKVAMADGEWIVSVTQVDNSAYPLVTIYVRVEDNDGLVGSLTEEQFTVTEDGQLVSLIDFRAGVPDGIHTVLTIDRSSSMEERNKIQGAKNAANAYIRQMRSQDQVALIAFDDQVDIVKEFTDDKEGLAHAVADIRLGDCTALYDSLYKSAELVETVIGRRTIILITDGIDCRELLWVWDEGSQHTLNEAIERSVRTEIPVHVIGLGDRGSGTNSAGIDEEVLKQIAAETAGNYYYTPTADELEALYKSLAVETQQEYVITYESPRPTYDGTRRDIQVKVGSTTGDSSGSGGSVYLEKHLLNIQSDPVIGVLCLLPLLGLLLVPTGFKLVSKPFKRSLPIGQTSEKSGPSTPQEGSIPPSPHKRQTPTPQPGVTQCSHCGYHLQMGTKFCNQCGQSTVGSGPASATANCPNCGHQMRTQAKFCARCGHRRA